MPAPSIGRSVHYRGYGTPDGRHVPACQAAIITGVPPAGTGSGSDLETVQLVVFESDGVSFTIAYHDEGAETPGAADCPSQEAHGMPLRYCPCGWQEASSAGGTWHWPERV
jgi:hypothetical protein